MLPCGTTSRLVSGTVQVCGRHLGPVRGGDAFGAVETPYGLRLLVADIAGRGHGLTPTADLLLRAWYMAAVQERSLPAIALRLHSLLTLPPRAERFVTAVLVTVRSDGTGETVRCGHPAPLVVHGDRAVYAEAGPPAPPLGLLDLADGWCAAEPLILAAGDRLLLYTDGVTEARSPAGDFYELHERAPGLLRADAETSLAALAADVIEHTGGGIDDDAALLLMSPY